MGHSKFYFDSKFYNKTKNSYVCIQKICIKITCVKLNVFFNWFTLSLILVAYTSWKIGKSKGKSVTLDYEYAKILIEIEKINMKVKYI